MLGNEMLGTYVLSSKFNPYDFVEIFCMKVVTLLGVIL